MIFCCQDRCKFESGCRAHLEEKLPELMTPPTKGVDACRACATPEPVVFFHVTHGSKSVTKDSQILETSL